MSEANTSEGTILNTESISPSINQMLSSSNNDKSVKNVLNNIELIPSQNSEREVVINQSISQDSSLTKENSKSGVIQIPQIIKNEPKIEINNNSTLNESVYTTINRDFYLIYIKLKYVINPFISREKKYSQIRQWDLWGPLILNLILACTLTFNTKDKSQITTLIFIIFWMGGFVIYLNNHFLGVIASIFLVFFL